MSNVSRETPEPDILDEIMGRDPAYSGEAPQRREEPGPEPSPAPEEPAPAPEAEQNPPKKDKRASVFLYLLILFGAAFMLLLMAYFVQMRNSETAYNDLRDSMTLSREELLDQIAELEESRDQFQGLLQTALEEVREKEEEIEWLNQVVAGLDDAALRDYWDKDMADTLGWMERFCGEGDWIMAAAIVVQKDYIFNPRNVDFPKSPPQSVDTGPSAVQTARWLELRERVLVNSGYVALWQSYSEEDGSDYIERPVIGADQEAMDTARDLFGILDHYTKGELLGAALDMAEFYDPDSGNMERMNSRYFDPCTTELLVQIKEELVERRFLRENGDGTLTECYDALAWRTDVSHETSAE